MPISEEKALDILFELIRKPETATADLPRIWNELLGIYNTSFAPPAEEPKKKKRRRPSNPNIGWPAGVSREEYRVWKEGLMARGVTENLNPQEYKRQRDAGEAQPAAAEPAKEKKARKAKA